ncbi:glycosyltransferase [Clostridium intestinale]|uniref:glycosyltransferase n=1 Tax=Clostridium intestinale TaxID=36845 RepID=UPI0028F08F7F|nr:glycosyltransferase [Clostridium intestinale]
MKKSTVKVKNELKHNIQILIENNSIKKAKILIDDYFRVIKDDADAYGLKSIISILEGKYDEAEIILKEALEFEEYNPDLLLNMSYLMDIKNDNKKAIEYFSKCKLFNIDNETNVSNIINSKSEINTKIKVIHGTIEIANQMNTLTKALNYIGVDAKNLNYYPNYLKYASNLSLDVNAIGNVDQANIETKKLASKLIPENDLFHFHFGSSLTLDQSDLPLLKELNKKVIMQYWGSDVRMYSKALKISPFVKVKNNNEESIKRSLENAARYIDHCIVDFELGEYVKDFYKNVHYSRVAIDLKNYEVASTQNKNTKMLIVHAPTSPEIKGTEFILHAIEVLKQDYEFDFKVVQNMSHKQATEIYKKADLIIDQLLIGSYGVLAVEAMAMGKPVICWISDFMKEKYPKDLPIICANPKDIKSKLEYIIKNRDMLDVIGKRGRHYAEKYHDMNKVAKNLLDIYKII